MAHKTVIESKLDLLEQELKCVICLSVFDDPHSLPCNHMFCYECIMEFFKQKNQCPLCKLPTIKRAIIKNQILGNVITAYRSLREALANGGQTKALPSPSPKKRGVPVAKHEEISNKRIKRSLDMEDPVPPGCMDFSLVIENIERHTPASQRSTRNMATQTYQLFDPYIRTNNTPSTPSSPPLSQSSKKNNEADTSAETSFLFPSPSRTTPSSSSTTPTSTTTRSPKVDLKNITDWNSLKKPTGASPANSTTPKSHHPQNVPQKRTPNGQLPKPVTPNLANSPHKPPIPTSIRKSLPNTRKSVSPLTLTSPSASPPPPATNGIPKKETPKKETARTPLYNYSESSLDLDNIVGTRSGKRKGGANSVNGNSKTENGVSKTGIEVSKPESSAGAAKANGVAKAAVAPKPKPKAKSTCEKVVVLPTSIEADALAEAKTILKELGGTMVTKYSPEVTHIIAGLTGAFCARRTIKYCLGVTEGKWVVSMDWLTQSKASSYWLAEDQFEVEGDSVTMGGPKSAREAIHQGGRPLFSKCQIFLLGAFTSPTRAEFKKLLQLGGAEVSGKTPAKKAPSKSKKQSQVVEAIVCNPTSFSSLEKEEIERLKDLGRPVIDTRWILDCVSFYQILPFTDYELSG